MTTVDVVAVMVSAVVVGSGGGGGGGGGGGFSSTPSPSSNFPSSFPSFPVVGDLDRVYFEAKGEPLPLISLLLTTEGSPVLSPSPAVLVSVGDLVMGVRGTGRPMSVSPARR